MPAIEAGSVPGTAAVLAQEMGIDLAAQPGEQDADVPVHLVEGRELVDQACDPCLQGLPGLGELAGAIGQRRLAVALEALDRYRQLVADLLERADDAAHAGLAVVEGRQTR